MVAVVAKGTYELSFCPYSLFLMGAFGEDLGFQGFL
jgi:hypothetical protein